LDDKEEDSQSNDQEPTILSTEDQKIKEKKPPNDRISFYKIVKDENNTTS